MGRNREIRRTSLSLYQFQQEFYAGIVRAFDEGARAVAGVLACGGGKSHVAAKAISDEGGAAAFIAHRAELVIGESLALARNGIRHRVIGQDALRRECTRRHLFEGLHNHVEQNSRVGVASVATLVGLSPTDPWLNSVRLLVPDECHHMLKANMWGKAASMTPKAHILGLSATLIRSDGKGLGSHADGLLDVMVEGPTSREIELMGYLAPHRIYAPPSDLDLSAVPVGASGDFSPVPLANAVHKSRTLIGDAVDHYRAFANGLKAMAFTVDVEEAGKTADAFRRAGITAEVVSGKTPPDLRNAIFRRFKTGDLTVLCSCDIAGEGFDMPEVECVILMRPTESKVVAFQQPGRVKRIFPGKTEGIIIDMVGNITKHCTVNRCRQTGELYVAIGEMEWSLDRRDRRAATKRIAEPITTCPECLGSYPRALGRVCPYCSHETPVAGRSSPEQVEGVLHELDPQALADLQGAAVLLDDYPAIPYGASWEIRKSKEKHHREKQEAQVALRDTIALWGGWYGRSVEEAQRGFWMTYGIDVETAKSLKKAEAEALRLRIVGDLTREGVAV